MKDKGRGKEIKLELFDNYNVLIGTVDNKKTVAVYVKLTAWAEPTDDNEAINYTSVIRKLDKAIRSHLYKTLDTENFDNELTIVDLDIRESGVAYNKRSFMSCEMTLFQTGNHQINSDFMIAELTDISEQLVREVFEPNQYFEFHKKKK